MRTMTALISRNRKLFFRDRGMFLSSLITPVILIVLYATFLANVYKDSFLSALPDTVQISDKLINGTVAAQLAAALLSVSCITVTFCVNLTMVQDLANGARKDFNVSPVKKSVIFLGYFLSTLLNSLMVNGLALVVCLIYMCKMGWYMSVTDVLWVILDEILLVLFGCALSSIICYPLKTQGQMSAVGTIMSAGYGFICGAYMPISNFDTGQQAVDRFQETLPGTYDLILMDLQMPVKGGLEAAAEIRSLSRDDAQEIPVIAMTANTLQEDREKALAAGMNAFIPKPFDVEQLYKSIEKFLH